MTITIWEACGSRPQLRVYLGRTGHGWETFLTQDGRRVRHVPPSYTPWQYAARTIRLKTFHARSRIMTEEQKGRVRLLVDALRSRKYAQGTGALHPREYLYCCLGVACEISGLGWWDTSYSNTIAYVTPRSKAAGSLPLEVQEWYGFLASNPHMTKLAPQFGMDTNCLSQLNDLHGWTFNQIADALEQEYLQ